MCTIIARVVRCHKSHGLNIVEQIQNINEFLGLNYSEMFDIFFIFKIELKVDILPLGGTFMFEFKFLVLFKI